MNDFSVLLADIFVSTQSPADFSRNWKFQYFSSMTLVPIYSIWNISAAYTVSLRHFCVRLQTLQEELNKDLEIPVQDQILIFNDRLVSDFMSSTDVVLKYIRSTEDKPVIVWTIPDKVSTHRHLSLNLRMWLWICSFICMSL